MPSAPLVFCTASPSTTACGTSCSRTAAAARCSPRPAGHGFFACSTITTPNRSRTRPRGRRGRRRQAAHRRRALGRRCRDRVRAEYGASAVVNVDMPLYQEPFAPDPRARARLHGDAFPQTWARFREHARAAPAACAGCRATRCHRNRAQYWAPLFEIPVEGSRLVRRPARARRGHVPDAVRGEPNADERAYVASRLPHAEIGVWPVGHHFASGRPGVSPPPSMGSSPCRQGIRGAVRAGADEARTDRGADRAVARHRAERPRRQRFTLDAHPRRSAC